MSLVSPVNYALLRADLWRLLALGFDCPTPAGLQHVRSLAADLSAALSACEHPMLEPVSMLEQALAAVDATALEPEYHALFTTQVLVSPYEGTYHRTERGAVIGDVGAFYTAFSLQVPEQSGPPDALHIELAFLAWLALTEAHAREHHIPEAIEVTREATRRFLEDHLGRWVVAFAGNLLHLTGNPVYVAAAQLLVETIALAAEELGIEDFHHLQTSQGVQEPDVMACPIGGHCA